MAESEKDKLKFVQQRLAVEKEIAKVAGKDISGVDIGENFFRVESIKEIINLNKEKTEFDRAILKSARDLNEQILKNITGLTTINKLTNSIKATRAKINKANEFSQNVFNNLSGDQQKLVEGVIKLQKEENLLLGKAASIQQGVDQGLINRIKGEEDIYETRFEALVIEEKIDDIIQNQLDNEARKVVASKGLTQIGQKQLTQNEKISDALQSSGTGFIELLSLIPGFGGVAAKQLELINENLEDVVKGDISIGEFKKQIGAFPVLFKSVFNVTNLIGASFLQLFLAFKLINQQQTLLRQNLGEGLKLSKGFTSEFATTVELLQVANSLTEQFAFNVNDAFSIETLTSATELVEAVGLTNEEAGQFALFSTISGDNLERQLESAVKQVNPLISARKILQQVGKISSFIALNFDNNVVALTKAASQAKELGLELSQVDKIADSLLNIESSITAEFEARMITGQELNLNAARNFALNNNLAGVTREIANNQKIISTFAGTNRVAQEAIADAIGLSRDEIATMLQQQKLLNGMDSQERKAKEYADQKNIENIKLLQKSFQRLFETSAVFLEPIVSAATALTSLLNYVVQGLNAVSSLTNSAGFKGIINLVGILGVLAAFFFGGPVAGMGALLGLGVIGAVGGMDLGNDMISPGYGKRTLLGPEGAIALNNDDTVIAGTRLGRNSGLSKGDIKAIAAAVRDGASQANINLDGGRVSSRLQIPSVINQRQYSI